MYLEHLIDQARGQPAAVVVTPRRPSRFEPVAGVPTGVATRADGAAGNDGAGNDEGRSTFGEGYDTAPTPLAPRRASVERDDDGRGDVSDGAAFAPRPARDDRVPRPAARRRNDGDPPDRAELPPLRVHPARADTAFERSAATIEPAAAREHGTTAGAAEASTADAAGSARRRALGPAAEHPAEARDADLAPRAPSDRRDRRAFDDGRSHELERALATLTRELAEDSAAARDAPARADASRPPPSLAVRREAPSAPPPPDRPRPREGAPPPIGSRARAQPHVELGARGDAATTVHVSIASIEVRAVQPAAAPRARRPAAAKPALGLDEYMRQRGGRAP